MHNANLRCCSQPQVSCSSGCVETLRQAAQHIPGARAAAGLRRGPDIGFESGRRGGGAPGAADGGPAVGGGCAAAAAGARRGSQVGQGSGLRMYCIWHLLRRLCMGSCWARGAQAVCADAMHLQRLQSGPSNVLTNKHPDLTGDLQACRGQQQSRRSAKRSDAAPGQPAGGRAVLKRRGRSLRVDIPPAGLTGELLLSAWKAVKLVTVAASCCMPAVAARCGGRVRQHEPLEPWRGPWRFEIYLPPPCNHMSPCTASLCQPCPASADDADSAICH